MWRKYMYRHHRPTWMKVDLSAVAHNYHLIRKKVYPKTIIPVVKADAYGLGAVSVVDRLIKEGANLFAVSLVEEAIELREAFPKIDIMIIGILTESDLEVCSKHNFIVSITNEPLMNAIKHLKTPIRCQIKLDTGMNRLGFKQTQDFIDFVNKFKLYPHISFEGIYTHFADSGGNEDFTMKQLYAFNQCLKLLTFAPNMIHVSNTSASLRFEQTFKATTHVRTGIGIYGLTPENQDYGLKNVMTLKTKVTNIKPLTKGEAIGYGLTYVAERDGLIATLPIGYADGYLRAYQGHYVSINQRKYPVVGRISMDITLIEVDHHVNIGDEVALMGNQQISIDDAADHIGTINYEVLCNITKRVPRVYKE